MTSDFQGGRGTRGCANETYQTMGSQSFTSKCSSTWRHERNDKSTNPEVESSLDGAANMMMLDALKAPSASRPHRMRDSSEEYQGVLMSDEGGSRDVVRIQGAEPHRSYSEHGDEETRQCLGHRQLDTKPWRANEP